jgi:predicted O-methyltransferase YrrM
MQELKKTFDINEKTRKIRSATASACLRLLTPNFYEVVKGRIDNIEQNEFPRPATSLIHGVYGEKPLVGVEIGTGYGKNALNLLKELCIDRLYCVDPFLPYFDGEDKPQTAYLSRANYTQKILAEHDNVSFIRKCSSDAYKELPKELDFVYVDGNHNYEYVLADLHNYLPLVHEKGVIAGHDIDWVSVRRAVEDFCKVNNLTPIIRSPDWIILK